MRLHSRSAVVGTPLGMLFWSLMHVSARTLISEWKQRSEKSNVPVFGWQTWSLKATVTVPLEEMEVSWFYLRTHPTQLETASVKLRLYSCSLSAAKLSNGRWKNRNWKAFLCLSLTDRHSSRYIIVWETNHNLRDTLCKTQSNEFSLWSQTFKTNHFGWEKDNATIKAYVCPL